MPALARTGSISKPSSELTVNARTVIRTPLLTLRTICRKVSVRCSTRATPKVSLEGIIKRNRFSPESINRSIT